MGVLSSSAITETSTAAVIFASLATFFSANLLKFQEAKQRHVSHMRTRVLLEKYPPTSSCESEQLDNPSKDATLHTPLIPCMLACVAACLCQVVYQKRQIICFHANSWDHGPWL